MFKRENKNLLNTLRNRYVLEINETNDCVAMWRKATTYVNIIQLKPKQKFQGFKKRFQSNFHPDYAKFKIPEEILYAPKESLQT